jgi:prevent-host-death family protein
MNWSIEPEAYMAVIEVNMHEAKTHFSQLVRRVMAGEEVVIARSGRPVARLVPYRPAGAERVLGRDAGLFTVPEDFDDPLPEDVLELFEA